MLNYYPQQVQAVLLLLGGRDVPTAVPSMDVSFNQNNKVVLINTLTISHVCAL